MLNASACALLPLLAACALVLPTVRIPPTSSATADESPGGAGVVVVTVLVVPEVVANAATPTGTDMIGVRASTTVARRTAVRTCISLFLACASNGCAAFTPSNRDQTERKMATPDKSREVAALK